MICLNIKNDLSFVNSEDVKYKRKELINNLMAELNKSHITLINLKEIESSQIIISVLLGNQKHEFVTLLKNITGAGWANKPKIKRVQVNNIKNNILFCDNLHSYNLIMGYYNYDNNPIIVCWDAYRYLNHNTVRSCYVSVDSLKVGYVSGYYEGVDSSQKIWIFKGEFFEKFLKSYVDYNLRVER